MLSWAEIRHKEADMIPLWIGIGLFGLGVGFTLLLWGLCGAAKRGDES